MPYKRIHPLSKDISYCPKEEVFSHNHKWDIALRRLALINKYKLPEYGAETWKSIHEFDDVFVRKLGVPTGYQLWLDDWHFARQRVVGCCPSLIRLCRDIPKKFLVTTEMLQPLLEGFTLEKALKNSRLFIVDLAILDKLQLQDKDAKVCSPIALFFLTASKRLKPVAIQLFQNTASDQPVFRPCDPKYTWVMAKMWFNNAEAQYHRACSYFGFTHLLIESIAVATHRQLSPSHPVYRLLAPYVRCVIPINCFEMNELLTPGAWVDRTCSIGSKGTLDLIALSWQRWKLDIHGYLPRELENRGVLDPNVLPDYPYRDDGLLLHEAIEKYTRTIIESFYEDKCDIVDDYELKEWSKELVSTGENGCGIKGVPGNGRFQTTNQLIMTLTSIIYICTVGHAAVNKSQYDEYSFVPNYPALLRGEPPMDLKWRDEKELLNCLPPKHICSEIMVVVKLLSERSTNGLSDFKSQYLYNPVAVKARERFLDDLKLVALTIRDRNRKREVPYEFLNPSSNSNI